MISVLRFQTRPLVTPFCRVARGWVCCWGNLRLQPKTAFSRFPLVHRVDLEGQQRVDFGPPAQRRSITKVRFEPGSFKSALRTPAWPTWRIYWGRAARHTVLLPPG